jgi:hypothetical protein
LKPLGLAEKVVCPNCQHERKPHDKDVHGGICPACGIAYKKWKEKLEEAKAPRKRTLPVDKHTKVHVLKERLLFAFLFVPSDRHESAFWGHLVLYMLFFVWGWTFIFNGLDQEYIYSSFLHLVSIPIHEYGHVMFSPLGRFSMFFGGSLLQLLLPFFLIILFSLVRRENFAASLMLWWMGFNFIDVAPYIQDAPLRELDLIGGRGPESHDWWNLLRMTGQLGLADFYARLWFTIGSLLIILSNIWGAFLLYVELVGRGVIPDRDEYHSVSDSDPD